MSAEERVARIAARQRGRVTTAQLGAAGLSPTQIATRVRRGLLIREHRGVYAVGHVAPAPFAAEQSALLACGEDAVLSHHSAAALWGIGPAAAVVHVTAPSDRRHAGVAVHRARLDRHDVRTRDALPVTSPARTLHDLAAVVPLTDLDRLVAEAHALGLVRAGAIGVRAGARGAGNLARVLGASTGVTRSQAERLFLRLVHRAGLPAPQTNVRVAGLEVDALWREQGLAVEIDGYASHGHRRAFERDRRKDRALRAAGLRPHRYSVRMITQEPEAVVADLTRALQFLK